MSLTRRPGIHDENVVWKREDWRHEVASGATQLGYWEWVYHQVEERGNEKPWRLMPVEIADRMHPYDLWEMPRDIKCMADDAMFVRVIQGVVRCELDEEQWDLVAEKMGVSVADLNHVLDEAETCYTEMEETR